MLTEFRGKQWFFEELYSDHTFGFEVSDVLVPEYNTGFQKLMVLNTPRFGKVLVLDNVVQFAEFDEYFYHESMAHTALFSHENPQNVLIIGGGDCGVAREVLKHHTVEKVTIVDIDPHVTEISKLHFPSASHAALNDSRLTILHEDASHIDTLSEQNTFDIILMDTTDNTGNAVPLFQGAFTDKIYSLLTTNGILMRLGGSRLLQANELQAVSRDTIRVFGNDNVLNVTFCGAATYYGGPFSLVIAGKNAPLTSGHKNANLIQANWYSESQRVHMLSQVIP
ncbi:fused MFS/spermidine synthase [Candidatus Kaiserbacteria bacterium]|nr:MAG: fused MFS/spermidine synthase [Candidatus Kaiserbacteria bacterium]